MARLKEDSRRLNGEGGEEAGETSSKAPAYYRGKGGRGEDKI